MKRITIICTSLMIMFLLFAGCGKDDNPVGPEDSDHVEAVGCVVKQGDVEVARAEKGAVTGQFIVEERVESALLSFHVIAEDGSLFQPDVEENLFAWESKRDDIADAIQYETDGDWGFHIKGFETGQTSIVFKILHGDHDDFVSLEIPIQVTASAGGGLGKQ